MGGIVFLDVPYEEKDEAKRLGARWNPGEREWYVPAGKRLIGTHARRQPA